MCEICCTCLARFTKCYLNPNFLNLDKMWNVQPATVKANTRFKSNKQKIFGYSTFCAMGEGNRIEFNSCTAQNSLRSEFPCCRHSCLHRSHDERINLSMSSDRFFFRVKCNCFCLFVLASSLANWRFFFHIRNDIENCTSEIPQSIRFFSDIVFIDPN